MRFDSETQFQEILRRGAALRRKKERQKAGTLCAASMALLAVLTIGIRWFPGGDSPGTARSVYGAFLLPAEAGGYVLVAVIAFVAGGAMMAAITHWRNGRREPDAQITGNKFQGDKE